jgi:hypothetical protein
MATRSRGTQRQRRGPRGKRAAPRLLLDPDLWGLAIGTLSATLVLLVDFLQGDPYVINWRVLIGAGMTFVVSYLATGLFVWYLHTLRERESAATAGTDRQGVPAVEESAEALEPITMAEEGP